MRVIYDGIENSQREIIIPSGGIVRGVEIASHVFERIMGNLHDLVVEPIGGTVEVPDWIVDQNKDLPHIVVHGMHGLGDNIHQRAVMRDLMRRNNVWLQTPWHSLYEDLIGQGLNLLPAVTSLRTQAKNARRELLKFSRRRPPKNAKVVRVWYAVDQVRRTGSVLGGMLATTNTEETDFRLPVQVAWRNALAEKFRWPGKPVMVYRPLVMRTEWQGCSTRNPDITAYQQLFNLIRHRFHVVSVADLVPKVEWISSNPIEADTTFHAGELEFETLAALFEGAALVYCSPGFAAPLAQSVGTPLVTVFGGFECSKSFSAGARFAPYLGIDPIHPVWDFSHRPKNKTIDVRTYGRRIQEFCDETAKHPTDRAQREANQLGRTDEAVSQYWGA